MYLLHVFPCIMARLTHGLQVVTIPKHIKITLVRCDMVNDGCYSIDTAFTA
jgi:hypothetical protein